MTRASTTPLLALGAALLAGSGFGMPSKVDFSYAFGTPHRITLGRPDASDRTLVDFQPGSLRLAWSYENLSMPNYPPLSFRTPPACWNLQIVPQIDGKPLARCHWTRLDGALPGADGLFEDAPGTVRVEALGGMTAALIRFSVSNTDVNPHQFSVSCESGWPSENPAWADVSQNAGDYLRAGWSERADRVLALGLGADAYSVQPDGMPPSSRHLLLVWSLKAGEKRTGWLVRPYGAYEADVKALRARDWSREFEQGKKEWLDLLARASQLTLPDAGVVSAYRACLADLFVMREPLGDGRIVAVPGTECYRAGNSGEPLIVAVALDQNGFHKESAAGSSVSFDMQEPDGNWADARGWSHTGWCVSGFKTWATMEHYRLTGDKKFLSKLYPRMLASSRWQERQRARSRTASGAERPLAYGLMPRGFGDCGLMNDGDTYGVFYPHNIWSVYADRCSLEAAQILGKKKEAEELKAIFETARADLLASIDRSAVKEQDYRWIPGTPGKTSGSCWGALNILSPCGLLPPDHELVTGTLRKIESNVSKGGQPIHTGWMADGAWVAITLDNIAEAQLARGNGDAAVGYLYSTLNHATPLLTWCEERGQEPGTTKCSGDRQHLWTPVAVVRALRDMMVLEKGDGLELALGTAREWLASGEPVGISGACTHFGTVSYRLRYDAAAGEVTGEVALEKSCPAAWAALHIRLPDGLKVKAVDAESKASVLPDGEGLRWEAPRKTLAFRATVGK